MISPSQDYDAYFHKSEAINFSVLQINIYILKDTDVHMVRIIDASITRFGKRQEDLISLGAEASFGPVRKFRDVIDTVIVSNSYSGEYCGISGINNLLTTRLSIDSVPSIRIDNTSGSGGSSILMAKNMIESGSSKCILVVGVEKMTGVSGVKSTSIIASLLHQEERNSGSTLPSLAGLMAKTYMRRYGATRESLAQVSVKNHYNGGMNEYAHFQKEVSISEVMDSRKIADPLCIYDFCPVSDGAASIVIADRETSETVSGKSVEILGCSHSSDTSAITSREDITRLKAVEKSVENAYRQSGSGPDGMDFAELHDMSTILEIVESEATGFFKRGEGWKSLENGLTTLHGTIPINTSGGLISKGHPIGATGVAQAAEAFLQLTGNAKGRQLRNPERGLAVNMAGFGNSSTATVFGVVQ